MHYAQLPYQHAHQMEPIVFSEELVLKLQLQLHVSHNQMDLNANGLLLMEILLPIAQLRHVPLPPLI